MDDNVKLRLAEILREALAADAPTALVGANVGQGWRSMLAGDFDLEAVTESFVSTARAEGLL